MSAWGEQVVGGREGAGESGAALCPVEGGKELSHTNTW